MPSNLGPKTAFQLKPLRNYGPTKTEKIGKMLKKNRQNVRGEIPAFNMKIIRENRQITQGLRSAMNNLQFGTNSNFLPQFV